MTTTITITEALAKTKLLVKKIDQKWESIARMAILPGDKKDPLEKEGGSAAVIERELQAINDLSAELTSIRTKIQAANQSNILVLAETTKSVADWLNWHRESFPLLSTGTQRLIAVIENYRRSRTNPANQPEAVINVDETKLRKQAEWLLEVEGQLDGQLSLFNATHTIEL